MTPDDRLWLGGWIGLCLGIAHDNWLLRIIGVGMFVVQLYYRRRDRLTAEETP